MIITDILWMVFLFFVPGVASFIVYHYFASYPIKKAFLFWTYSALWGLFDYTIFEFFMVYFYGIPFGKYLKIWTVFQYEFSKIEPVETFFVTVLGLFLGLFGGCIMREVKKRYTSDLYTWFWRNLKKQDSLCSNQVKIIDHKNKCIYTGKVKCYTYLSEVKEFVLEQALITDLQGNSFGKSQDNSLAYISLENNTFSLFLLSEDKCQNKEVATNNHRLEKSVSLIVKRIVCQIKVSK